MKTRYRYSLLAYNMARFNRSSWLSRLFGYGNWFEYLADRF